MFTVARRRKKKPACLVRPPWRLLPCSLWHREREVWWSEQGSPRASPFRGSHEPLGTGSCSYFPERFLLCDFARGSWMIPNCAPCWGELHREGVTSWLEAEQANQDHTVLELAQPSHAVFEVSKTEIKLLSYYAGGSSRRRDSTRT